MKPENAEAILEAEALESLAREDGRRGDGTRPVEERQAAIHLRRLVAENEDMRELLWKSRPLAAHEKSWLCIWDEDCHCERCDWNRRRAKVLGG